MTKSRALLLMLAALIALGLTTAWADSSETVEWVKITGPDGIVVECQPGREDVAKALIPEISKRLKDAEAKLARIKASTQTMKTKQGEVLQFLAGQMSLDAPTTEMKRMLDSIPDSVADQMVAGLPKLNRVRIWDAETARKIIDSGKTIPGLEMDPQTRRVESVIDFKLGFTVNNENTVEYLGGAAATPVLVLLIESASTQKAVGEAAKQLDDTMLTYNRVVPMALGTLIHEAAETGIVWGFNLTSPFRRWFCDGMANYLAVKGLEKLEGKAAAGEFLLCFDATQFENMKDHVDLRYWRAGEWEENSPVHFDQSKVAPAYAFATDEIFGLVKRYGADVIPAIFKEIAKTKSPDENTVLSAIQTVTKEDFGKVLDKYGSKAPKDKLSRLAIKGMNLTDTDPKSSEPDGKSGVWVALEYAAPESPVEMRLELIGVDGKSLVKTAKSKLTGKSGVGSCGFPLSVDTEPGRYKLKIYLEDKYYREVDFEVQPAS